MFRLQLDRSKPPYCARALPRSAANSRANTARCMQSAGLTVALPPPAVPGQLRHPPPIRQHQLHHWQLGQLHVLQHDVHRSGLPDVRLLQLQRRQVPCRVHGGSQGMSAHSRYAEAASASCPAAKQRACSNSGAQDAVRQRQSCPADEPSRVHFPSAYNYAGLPLLCSLEGVRKLPPMQRHGRHLQLPSGTGKHACPTQCSASRSCGWCRLPCCASCAATHG